MGGQKLGYKIVTEEQEKEKEEEEEEFGTIPSGGGPEFLWPDIDILRLDIHILRPNIDILRPDINILRQNIDILRPKILRSIIMFKHYYALGPPAYPDIHIACT